HSDQSSSQDWSVYYKRRNQNSGVEFRCICLLIEGDCEPSQMLSKIQDGALRIDLKALVRLCESLREQLLDGDFIDWEEVY
ncbi:hypothetical protein HID58_003942, partial [Brassica napus]